MIQNYNLGGCKMIDIRDAIKSQRIKWIKQYFNDIKYQWKDTIAILLNVRHPYIFLKTKFAIPKKTSVFYKELLTVLQSINVNNVKSMEDVQNQYLWYNSSLKFEYINTAYFEEYVEKGISQIKHIMNCNGVIKTFDEVCDEFAISRNSFMLYNSIKCAIPRLWKNSILSGQPTIGDDLYIHLDKENYNISNIKDSDIYVKLVAKKFTQSKAIEKYS